MSANVLKSALAVGQPEDGLLYSNAVYFEYSQAADPIGSGAITGVPVTSFGPEIYQGGPSAVVPLDLSAHLGLAAPATSPALCANFVSIKADESLVTDVNATSQLFYVLSGQGTTDYGAGRIDWSAGDFFTLPAASRASHGASEPSVLYWVHDEPLLRYLGAQAISPCFAPTHYRHVDAQRWLDQVATDPKAAERSRVSVLLANKVMDQTMTITNVLWAMLGLLPKGGSQAPHRHQSVALDLVVDCQPGCYTLLGELGPDGRDLVNVERVDWAPGTVFVTPPGRWHSHHNESGADAHIIPIQDAGLHTYLRSLDIRFMTKDQGARALASVLRPATASSKS